MAPTVAYWGRCLRVADLEWIPKPLTIQGPQRHFRGFLGFKLRDSLIDIQVCWGSCALLCYPCVCISKKWLPFEFEHFSRYRVDKLLGCGDDQLDCLTLLLGRLADYLMKGLMKLIISTRIPLHYPIMKLKFRLKRKTWVNEWTEWVMSNVKNGPMG